MSKLTTTARPSSSPAPARPRRRIRASAGPPGANLGLVPRADRLRAGRRTNQAHGVPGTVVARDSACRRGRRCAETSPRLYAHRTRQQRRRRHPRRVHGRGSGAPAEHDSRERQRAGRPQPRQIDPLARRHQAFLIQSREPVGFSDPVLSGYGPPRRSSRFTESLWEGTGHRIRVCRVPSARGPEFYDAAAADGRIRREASTPPRRQHGLPRSTPLRAPVGITNGAASPRQQSSAPPDRR